MTREDSEFAKKLTAYLDEGTSQLKAGTAYKLQLARQAALARLNPRSATSVQLNPAMAGAGAGAGMGRTGGTPRRTTLKLWLGVLIIVTATLGYQQWQAYQQVTDLADTDAAILSSDLPIDAYLDRGFQNWLRSDSD